MPPLPARRRLQDATHVALPLLQDINEGLAVERQRHCAPRFEIVEGRRVAVDQEVTIDAAGRGHFAMRLR